MAMLVARRDDRYATSRDALMMSFQPSDLFQYRLAHRRQWLGAFEGDLWCYLHSGPDGQHHYRLTLIRYQLNGCTPAYLSRLSNIDHSSTLSAHRGVLKSARIQPDRPVCLEPSDRRKVLVMVRERGGNSVPAVFSSKSQAASFIRSRIANGTDLHADEAASRTDLHEHVETKRINHQEAYSLDGACAGMAEEYVSRLRHAGIRIHPVAGACHPRYRQESSSREDNCRASNGDPVDQLELPLDLTAKESVPRNRVGNDEKQLSVRVRAFVG